MRVKVSEGKTKDVAIIDVTPENYIVPDNEKHLYHCVIEIKKFDSETGKRLSIPCIQKFGKKGYENSIADNLKKQGYTITVLHDPNESRGGRKGKGRESQSRRGKSQSRCQSESRGGRQSPCRGKGSIESRDLGRIESGGRYPGDNCKGTQSRCQSKSRGGRQSRGQKVTEY